MYPASWCCPPLIWADNPLFTNPVNEFQTQGRTTNTYNLSDDAAWQHGRHYVQFGFHYQHIGVEYYDRSGGDPDLHPGHGFRPASRWRGAISQESPAPTWRLPTLCWRRSGGYVDRYDETFNVTSRNSGYVSNAPFLRHFLSNDYSFYVQDKWRADRRVTDSHRGCATIARRGGRARFAGTCALYCRPEVRLETPALQRHARFRREPRPGSPWYQPREEGILLQNIGFAWDVFGNGKRTALRGGYSISYVE